MARSLATFALIACVCIPLAGCQEVEFSEVRKENTDNSVVNSFGMEFESIPAGAFTDLDGQHKEVKSFFLQNTELTFRQFNEVIAKRDGVAPTHQYQSGESEGRLPVPINSWNEAYQLAALLTELDEQYAYRLPTESEWLYACAGGENIKGDVARQSVDNRQKGTGWLSPVKSKPANRFGIFDMLSNLGEYCERDNPSDGTSDAIRLVKGLPTESWPPTFCITDRKTVPKSGTEDLLIGVRFVLNRKAGK